MSFSKQRTIQTPIITTPMSANAFPYHLCDELTLQEFADLVAYIQSLDLVGKSL